MAKIHVDTLKGRSLVSFALRERRADLSFCRSMKAAWFLGSCLCFVSVLCYGTDAGTITVLDGGARLLRGATWYRLAEGVRVQDGDVVDASDRAQVQLELTSGNSVNVVGPASLYVVSAAVREGKQPSELYLPLGWVKLAAKPPAPPVKLRTPLGVIDAGAAVAVVRANASAFEVFVESGSARVSEVGRSGPDAAPREVRGGDFVGRSADRPLAVGGGAPQPFVTAMPRHFMDTLPSRAEKYRTVRVELAVDRPISFAEAEPWLNGPYRRVFIKRLQPRLSDPTFRAAVGTNVQAYPEWGSVLTPPQPPPPQEAKAQPAEKAPEKKDSGLPWPFSGSRR
jgi:hypothetical protein